MDLLRHLYPASMCGTVWDGYPHVDQHNTTYSADEEDFYELTTVPLFGYNDYYALEEDQDQGEGGALKTRYIWCGGIYSVIFKGMLSHTKSVRFVFHHFSSNLDEALSFVLSDRFAALLAPTPVTAVEALSGLGRCGEYVVSLGNGNMVLKRATYRKEFIFMHSFDRPSWSGIACSLLAVSLALTLSRTKIKRIKMKHSCGVFLDLWVWWIFKLANVLLGEGERALDRPKRGRFLLGIWFLTATLVGGCMAGSMRDLMSVAEQLIVPASWDDMFREPFCDKILITGSWMPDWKSVRARYFPDVRVDAAEEDLPERVKLVNVSGMESLDVFVTGVIRILFGYPLDQVIFMMPYKQFMMLLWVGEIFKDNLLEYITTAWPSGRMSADIYENFMEEVRGLVVTADQSTHPMFAIYGKEIGESVVHTLDHL